MQLSFLLLSVLATFSSCSFITERSNPRLYAHFIKAFSPAFPDNQGEHIMRSVLKAADISNPLGVYAYVAEAMRGRELMNMDLFDIMFQAMQVFYRVKGIERILIGARNVVEEAWRMCLLVFKETEHRDEPAVTAVDNYLFALAPIYLRGHPDAQVLPCLLKYTDIYFALKPTPVKLAKTLTLRGMSVWKMVKAREFTRMYLSSKHTFENSYSDVLHLVQKSRIEAFRDGLIGFDPSLDGSVAQQQYLRIRSKLNRFMQSALDQCIIRRKTSNISEESFSFKQDSYAPLITIRKYLEERLHLEHPGVDQLIVFNMWISYTSFFKQSQMHFGRESNFLCEKYDNVLEMIPKEFGRIKQLLKAQMTISLFALNEARMPIIRGSSLEEYVNMLPVWLKELRKRMKLNMFPRLYDFLREELDFVADLMNMDLQRREDLLLAARYILESY